MASSVIRNFMKQQGFPEEPESVCDMHFSGLYFQPRIVGPLMVLAILLGSAGALKARSSPTNKSPSPVPAWFSCRSRASAISISSIRPQQRSVRPVHNPGCPAGRIQIIRVG